jgi:hypothetical protein
MTADPRYERKMPLKLSRISALAIASCLALSALASAQPAAQPAAPPFSFVSITTITVKPSAVPEFEASIKKINAGAVKIGVSPSNVWSVGRGGPGFTYVATVRFAKWADMDDRPSVNEILTKAYGEAEGAKIGAAGRAAIESLSGVVVRVLPELSSAPSLVTPFAHVRVTRINVKPGTGGKFEAYIAKLKAAQDKVGGYPGVIRYTNVLGPGNTYMGAYFFNKFAQWDAAPSLSDTLKKVYGDGEARMLEGVSQECIVGTEIYVLDYRADLTTPK